MNRNFGSIAGALATILSVALTGVSAEAGPTDGGAAHDDGPQCHKTLQALDLYLAMNVHRAAGIYYGYVASPDNADLAMLLAIRIAAGGHAHVFAGLKPLLATYAESERVYNSGVDLVSAALADPSALAKSNRLMTTLLQDPTTHDCNIVARLREAQQAEDGLSATEVVESL